MSLPTLTPEQRADALVKAAESRQARSAALAEVKAGAVRFADVLANTESPLQKAKVMQVLKAVPGVGPVTAVKLMDEAGIAANRRVAGLGDRQRETLNRLLPV